MVSEAAISKFFTTILTANLDDTLTTIDCKWSHHDANFVITGSPDAVIMTTICATSDDKVGIMKIWFSVTWKFYL